MRHLWKLILIILTCSAFTLQAQEKQSPYAHIDSILAGHDFLPPNDLAINEYIRDLSKKKIRDQHECFVAIRNVNIVDAEHNKIKKHRTVIQQDGVIIAIKRSFFTSTPKGIKVINGKGMYLAPGLTDMHVHFSCTNRDRLLYLLYGVTTIRNMSGSLFHLDDKEYIDSKDFLSPKLYTCGPDISTIYCYSPVDTAAIKKEVREQSEAGYDFIKAPRMLNDTCFFAILDEAKRIGIRVAAELPANISFTELIKYKEIITIEGFSGDGADKKIFLDNASQSWHCPNMIATSDILKVKTAQQFLKKQESAVVSDKQNALIINPTINQYIKVLAPVYKTKSSFYKAYVKAGGMLLTGTESGTSVPMLIPGAAVHGELKELLLLGLTTDQAILAATLNPAKILDQENLSGTIEKGKRADFVLLTEDPLLKIENYKSIYGVMVNGTWLSPEDLKEIKSKLQEIK